MNKLHSLSLRKNPYEGLQLTYIYIKLLFIDSLTY